MFPVNTALRAFAQGQSRPCPAGAGAGRAAPGARLGGGGALCCPRLPVTVTAAGARPLPGRRFPASPPCRAGCVCSPAGKERLASGAAQHRSAAPPGSQRQRQLLRCAQRPRAPAWDSAASSATLGLALLRGAAGGCCTAAEEDGVNSGLLRRRSNGLVFQSASADVHVPIGLNTQVTK